MRVGTSYLPSLLLRRLGDHPHACGDKVYTVIVTSHDLGSSPCVWGQEHSILTYTAHHRIIPMRVGTSNKSMNVLCYGKDHPHACGDKRPI